MSDSKSLNTSLLEVKISSKHEPVCIRDLSDLTVQIIFDSWWASLNVGSEQHIVWNDSRHVHSWWFYLHCGIEETGSPGIICIVCHQLLPHSSEHGTRSIGRHLLAKAHIAKLNEWTESEVTELTSSTGDETALAILMRQVSWGLTIVSSQRKIIFDIQFDPYWPKWQIKCSKLAAEDFENSEFHQDTWNGYVMLGCVSAEIPWNTISNLELQGSYKAVRNHLVLPSATTHSIICWREYALTVDAIQKPLPSQNKVSLALNGWPSTNTDPITSVMAWSSTRFWWGRLPVLFPLRKLIKDDRSRASILEQG